MFSLRYFNWIVCESAFKVNKRVDINKAKNRYIKKSPYPIRYSLVKICLITKRLAYTIVGRQNYEAWK